MKKRFEAFDDDYLCFEKVENKRSKRADLHAFILLDEFFPGKDDIICASEHDEIYLSIGNEDVEKLTDKQILELTRCGVRLDSDGCLCMFT
jgi:hypothetical protein